MEQSPAFSFYAKDFMLGTVTMSLAERGAYITLLAYQWDHGDVPDDIESMARLLGCSKSQARGYWQKLREKFPAGADGKLRNARLEVERQKQAERRAQLRENGRAGGRPPKNQKDNQAETNRFPVAKPNGNQNESLPSPSPSPSPVSRPVPSSVQGPGAGAGTYPRDHLTHGFCGRFCVKAETFETMARRYGDGGAEAVQRFLQRLSDGLGPDESPGGPLWVLQHFDAWLVAMGRVKAAPVSGRMTEAERKRADWEAYKRKVRAAEGGGVA